MLGVAAAGAGAGADHGPVLMTGVSGLIAGALSMAAGEFVSVHSQADTERAKLKQDPLGERRELAAIYVACGLDPLLADQVAAQLVAHDAQVAHARDELGLFDSTAAEAHAGCIGLSGELRSRCSAAARRCDARGAVDAAAGEVPRLAGVSGGLGRCCRADWRGKGVAQHLARGVLRCLCDGQIESSGRFAADASFRRAGS